MHLAFGFLILVFSFEKGFISKVLKIKLFQNLGLWSYSIYLNHILMITLFRMLVLKIVGATSKSIIVFEVLLIIVCIFYSSLTYKYIEQRFYTRLKQL